MHFRHGGPCSRRPGISLWKPHQSQSRTRPKSASINPPRVRLTETVGPMGSQVHHVSNGPHGTVGHLARRKAPAESPSLTEGAAPETRAAPSVHVYEGRA